MCGRHAADIKLQVCMCLYLICGIFQDLDIMLPNTTEAQTPQPYNLTKLFHHHNLYPSSQIMFTCFFIDGCYIFSWLLKSRQVNCMFLKKESVRQHYLPQYDEMLYVANGGMRRSIWQSEYNLLHIRIT